MAPEMENGRADPAKITPAADVYSLGRLLYWLFGATMFEREKHRAPECDLRGKEPLVAHSLLYQLLDKSIVEEPKDRFFQDGTEFAVAVEACAEILTMGGHVLDLAVPQLCSYCRAGNYDIKVDPRWWEREKSGFVEKEGGEFRRKVMNGCATFGFEYLETVPRLVLHCPHCGHVEQFTFSTDKRFPLQGCKFPPPPKS